MRHYTEPYWQFWLMEVDGPRLEAERLTRPPVPAPQVSPRRQHVRGLDALKSAVRQ
jgi:hypothetical protein